MNLSVRRTPTASASIDPRAHYTLFISAYPSRRKRPGQHFRNVITLVYRGSRHHAVTPTPFCCTRVLNSVPYDPLLDLTSSRVHAVSAYGIRAGSTIALVGGGDPIKPPSSKATSAQSARAPRTEESTIAQITTELDKVRSTLAPDVDGFLSALSPASAAAHAGPEPTTTALPTRPATAASLGARAPLDFQHEHVRLGELLLQSLLRLDAINTEGEWEVARRTRKSAVKEVQALLDRLDGGWRARAKTVN